MDDFHYIFESIEEEVSDYFFISLVTYKRFFRVEFSLCLPAPQSLSALSTVNQNLRNPFILFVSFFQIKYCFNEDLRYSWNFMISFQGPRKLLEKQLFSGYSCNSLGIL